MCVDLELDQDDIDGIQALYGRKEDRTTTTRRPTTTRRTTRRPSGGGGGSGGSSGGGSEGVDNEDLCSDPDVDTVFATEDGSFYVFKGEYYWKLTEDSVEPGLEISALFSNRNIHDN